MAERWRRELSSVPTFDDPRPVWTRIQEGPRGDWLPPAPGRGQRVLAGVVAFAVFAGAAAFAFAAFNGSGDSVGGDGPSLHPFVITIPEMVGDQPPAAIFALGGSERSVAASAIDGTDPWLTRSPMVFHAGLPEGTAIRFEGGDAIVSARFRAGVEPALELATDGSALVPGELGWRTLTVDAAWADHSASYSLIVPVIAAGRDQLAVTVLDAVQGEGALPSAWATYGGVEVALGMVATTLDLPRGFGLAAGPTSFPAPVGSDSTFRYEVLTDGGGELVVTRIGRAACGVIGDVLASSEHGGTVQIDRAGPCVATIDAAIGSKMARFALAFVADDGAVPPEPPASSAPAAVAAKPGTVIVEAALTNDAGVARPRAVVTYGDQRLVACTETFSTPRSSIIAECAYRPDLVVTVGEGFDISTRATPAPLSMGARVRGDLVTVKASWPGNVKAMFVFRLRVIATTPDPNAGPSGGGELVVVPDVIGLDDQEALMMLDRAGFALSAGFRAFPDADRWTVVETHPAAGTEAPIGSSIRVLIATEITPLPGGAADALRCQPAERVAFGGPRLAITPGGAAYITGNTWGIEDGDDVVQVTFEDGQEWHGLWHVVRDGSVVAVVDFESLDGVACAGSGVAAA